jgi:hypothetical protein
VSTGQGKSDGSGDPPPIEVQTRFERFPAAVKGAFVMRGADGNPHVVRVDQAQIARFPSGPATPFPAEERILDANPIRDLFVPFEAPVLDLSPGWYVIESSIQVDAARAWTFASRAFAIPWPRSEVRRGSVSVGKSVALGDRRVALDRVEMTANWSAVIWKPMRATGESAAQPGSLSQQPDDERGVDGVLIADGQELEDVPDDAVGVPQLRSAVERRTISYPVPRSCTSLAALIRLHSGEQSDPIPIRLT